MNYLHEPNVYIKKDKCGYCLKLNGNLSNFKIEKKLKITEDLLWSVLGDGIMIVEDCTKSKYVELNKGGFLYECLLAYIYPRIFDSDYSE